MTRDVRIVSGREKVVRGITRADATCSNLHNMNKASDLPIQMVRAVAASAELDPRTAIRALSGLPVRPVCRERLVAALSRHGIDPRVLDGKRAPR